MKIKFTRYYEVKDGSGTEYKEGDELECNDASGAHFMNRSAAVEVKKRPGRPKINRGEVISKTSTKDLTDA